eukprot:12941941-Ditylum_brightwellii.AAC.1
MEERYKSQEEAAQKKKEEGLQRCQERRENVLAAVYNLYNAQMTIAWRPKWRRGPISVGLGQGW